LLDKAKKEGKVLIQRKDGSIFEVLRLTLFAQIDVFFYAWRFHSVGRASGRLSSFAGPFDPSYVEALGRDAASASD
jgi:hypothetical protein